MKIDTSKTTAVQLAVLESASNALNTLHNFELNELIPKKFRVLTEESTSFLGMQMKLHHAFTTSAFSKFAFEHGLMESIRYSGDINYVSDKTCTLSLFPLKICTLIDIKVQKVTCN